MEWKGASYAKINLGLHVLAKLPNGFHLIETGLVYINWADQFVIKKAKQTRLSFSDLSIPTDETNLVSKAIVLLRGLGLKGDYDIQVKKNIPAGAGLGGGSSNAAFTLKAFNKIENLGIPEPLLAELATKLGSDVPFFLKNEAVIASGTGTKMEPASIQPNYWIVTAFPKEHSSTAEAYQFCEPDHEKQPLVKLLAQDPEEDWPFVLFNDLEPAVIPRIHAVGNFKDAMIEAGAFYSAMTGSGSAVFGLFEQEFVATEAFSSLMQLGYPASLTPPAFVPDQRIYIRESE